MELYNLYSKEDLARFLSGVNYRAFQLFGVHFCHMNGSDGCRFAVWAPHAKEVFLIGDFNHWEIGKTKMYRLWDTGVFSAFIPSVQEYAHYKYAIITQDGRSLVKADPYAFFFEQPMNNASRVVSLDYLWNDADYMAARDESRSLSKPMNIYEVHLGSWRRGKDGEPLNYRDLASPLLDYMEEMHYTHLEIMPITEFPLPASWGYQTSGYFAPTSKYGTCQDFMYFIDQCHQRNIPVILDWVPSHFPKDAFALARFDGSPLYEYADPRVGEHKQWGTLVFDYEKKEVVNFLLSSAVFWAEYYHIDGFRVDAVSSMIYLDYMRSFFIKNRYGGTENLEALDFLRMLNSVMHREFPSVLMIAEESSEWRGITWPVTKGGLGFDFKWNMGWMNDTLRYMGRDAVYRKSHHNELTFSMVYAFNERYILPFSHDEVVHSEGSMIEKMSGDYWQKFANLRLLYGYMYAHPGKKLLFMGNEFAQFIEWKYYDELEWFMLRYNSHQKMQDYVKELNLFYKQTPALWEEEMSWDGFQWINADDNANSTLSFLRWDSQKTSPLIVVCHFTPDAKEDYRIGVPAPGEYEEAWNSDHRRFGGSGVLNHGFFVTEDIPWDGYAQSFAFRCPPLACVYFRKIRSCQNKKVRKNVEKKGSLLALAQKPKEEK